jgi:serine/threonine protein kinase
VAADVFGLVGQTLEGRYSLLSVVGMGGFGVVYRGVQITFETPVAVKVLRTQADAPQAQERLLARFREEAALLARLNRFSPNVVRVLDHGVHALTPSRSVPYLVMEWLDGRPLDEALAAWRRLGEVPMTEARALALLSPGIEALAVAHRGDAGAVVAHRDIKPQNLFVLKTGGIKVLDLGIAKVMQPGEGVTAPGSETSSGFSAFSPLYGAPEQFHPRRFGQTGPWTDVHALALVLVELVSGRRALDSDDYPSGFAASTSPERPTPHACGAKVSEAFERVCARALSLDPRQRYQSAGELLEALRNPEREAAREAPLASLGAASASQPVQSHLVAADPLDLAVRQHEERFRLDPTQPAPLHDLFKVHTARGAHDATWCVASALVAMGAASDEERRLHDDLRPTGLPSVKGRLDDATWRDRLFTPEASGVICKVFEALAPAALAAKVALTQHESKPGALGSAYAQDPKTSTVMFAKLFGWAAAVLGVASPPQLYVSTALNEGLVDVLHERPIVVAGTRVLLVPPTDVTFTCGRHLAGYRPELFIRTLYPTVSELELILFAGIKISRPAWSPPSNLAAISAVAAALARSITPTQTERLRSAVGVIFDEGTRVNLKQWSRGLEQTAIRAGLLLCGDLSLARKVLEAEPPWPGSPTAADRFSDLIVYAISAQYLEARKVIGVALA